MERETGGVFRIKAGDLSDAMRQLGEAHATDRPAQLALMRILATGRATECLADEPDLLEVDRFFRWIGLYRGAEEQAGRLKDRERAAVEAYCEGLNVAMAVRRKPMPFRVWGYTWEPWRPEDVLTLVRLMAWVGLVSAQVSVEKAIVEMVQAGAAVPKLLELMNPGLEGCDFDLLRQIKLVSRITPEALAANGRIGSMVASNNWVVAPSKSESGRALLANDMHLEVNRLPSVWYEVILDLGDDYLIGTTVPGLPGIVTGRNRRLAWGITYTEADTTDFFVEDCREGKYLRDGEWKKFDKNVETIRRRKHEPDIVEVYRNDHGLLLGDAAKEGKYLCMNWTAWHCEAADVLEAMYSIDLARSVEEGMKAVEKFHFPSLNWVFADAEGNIGYRMAGLFPLRRKGWSGLYPVPGWTSENDWQGFVPAGDLPSAYNPSEGFFATANQDLGAYGRAAVQNCPMNVHRDRRIRQRLAEKEKLDMDDMKSIQLDVYSTKVEQLAPIFIDAMPDGAAKSMLLDWNFEFDPWSSAATLFEELYRRALAAVFCRGEGAVPEPMFLHLRNESSVGLNMDFFFERVLLGEESKWFDGKSRDEILKEAFADIDGESWPAWGTVNKITMVNIFFGGKLPGFLGMDRGPFAMPGSPDTPRQGSLYRDAGRDTSFCPSNRFITDMGTDEAHTVIPGGPSEKRFSGLYVTDVESWLSGRYKVLKGK